MSLEEEQLKYAIRKILHEARALKGIASGWRYRSLLVLYYLGEYHLIGYKPIVELKDSFYKNGALSLHD